MSGAGGEVPVGSGACRDCPQGTYQVRDLFGLVSRGGKEGPGSRGFRSSFFLFVFLRMVFWHFLVFF